jgi:uncharacterized protein
MRKGKAADLRALDLPTLCRNGQTLEGQLPLAEMQRLAASLYGAPAGDVAWSAAGSQRPAPGGEPETWLHLKAEALVTLQCQRCLLALATQVVVDRHFRFARDEDEAAALDEEIEEDVLVMAPRLNLQELLEDELILALPLVPRHEQCLEPLVAAADDAGADEVKPNPFAVLAALRDRGPH